MLLSQSLLSFFCVTISAQCCTGASQPTLGFYVVVNAVPAKRTTIGFPFTRIQLLIRHVSMSQAQWILPLEYAKRISIFAPSDTSRNALANPAYIWQRRVS